jgi:D-2-hydroxyacid dehydrogenase (NADP+)
VSVSRRSFLGAVPAAAAAQVVVDPITRGDLKKPQGPIRIAAMSEFSPEEIKKIESAASDVKVLVSKSPAEFRANLREADVVYGNLRGADLDYAPKLKWLQAGGAGMEGMDDGIRKSSLVVTNMARIFAPGISETAMGLLLCLTRGITTYYMPQFNKRQMNPVGTVKSPDHIELGGKTMGIVGMGGIGSWVARRAHYGFDMNVIATDAKPVPKPEYVSELHDPTYFREMVSRVDVLVSAAPHTKITEGMFNEEVFRSMKKTAYFLALSRGKLYDDMALVKALKEHWIAGAGLDVFPV